MRVHSECLTGDALGRAAVIVTELHAALAQIEREGKRRSSHARQEGRGIGLLNKLRAYKRYTKKDSIL